MAIEVSSLYRVTQVDLQKQSDISEYIQRLIVAASVKPEYFRLLRRARQGGAG
jgi:hypothetical protein